MTEQENITSAKQGTIEAAKLIGFFIMGSLMTIAAQEVKEGVQKDPNIQKMVKVVGDKIHAIDKKADEISNITIREAAQMVSKAFSDGKTAATDMTKNTIATVTEKASHPKETITSGAKYVARKVSSGINVAMANIQEHTR